MEDIIADINIIISAISPGTNMNTLLQGRIIENGNKSGKRLNDM
jgi:hypothetical protein